MGGAIIERIQPQPFWLDFEPDRIDVIEGGFMDDSGGFYDCPRRYTCAVKVDGVWYWTREEQDVQLRTAMT